MTTTRPRPSSVIRSTGRRHLQRDPHALVASAALMTGAGASGKAPPITTEGWQNQAWGYFETTGELKFAVTWKANALSRVNLVAAIPPKTQGDEPTPIDLEQHPELARHVAIVAEIGGGPAGQGQILAGCARMLTVPGVGYIHAGADPVTDSFDCWEVLSNEEVRRAAGGAPSELEVADGETGEWAPIGPTDVIVKVWNNNPRRRHLPDSPTRGVLSSLEEIRLLTARLGADVRSRLAGNGLLIMPDEITFPPGQVNADGVAPEGDVFIESFIQATQIPITDQSAPAAATPLVVKVPGQWVKDVQHLTFYSDFDVNLDPLRQAAIKRLALGLDMPPEVLLGLGDSNHWSAWQINEDAITMQIEPMAEVICHALTIGFLIPALEAEGLDGDSVMVWYDTSDLAARPNLAGVAGEAYAHRAISRAAYLGYLGLDATDAPDDAELRQRVLLDLAVSNPALAPLILVGLGVITADQAAMLGPGAMPAGGPIGSDTAAPLELPTSGPPATQDDANAQAVLAAADAIVVRALERAGGRLRSAAGRRLPGGDAAIVCADLSTLHTSIDATTHAPLETLLADAWTRVDQIAARYGYNPESLTETLNAYTRGLIAAGHPHTFERLATALGVHDDRHDLAPV